jgi:hypothetical protein
MPPEAKELKMLATIKSFLERCAREKMSGELVLAVNFAQGSVTGMKVERREKVSVKEVRG